MRYSNGTTATKYAYTGQFSNMDDFGLMFYNARWYDPTIGRFVQADSIVPAGVQGYDRYAYANNAPVLYSDPSGHCVNGDIECRDELRETEEKYHVSIDDKGGHWTTEGLSSISEGMGKLFDAMGGTKFNKLFDGVRFSVAGDADRMGTTGHRDVQVGSNKMNDQGYVAENTVHEFAHIWDNTCNDCMSKGLMEATGGKQYTQYSPPSRIRFGWTVYEPGGVPPSWYHANRGEDWAESVKTYFYPKYGTLYLPRLNYVADRIAGFGVP